MNKKIVHDALILFAFTIVLGLLLGVVYGVTKPSIDKVNEEKTQNAYKQVFTDADHFTDYADFDADAAQALLDENGYSDEIETVVAAQDASLREGRFEDFLNMIKASGDSSFKYLQNVYTNRDVQNQAVSIALAVSENVLGNHGVCRVHGGGFAGTIQAFVKNDFVEEYRKALDAVFGEGSCHVLKVRKYGGMKVIA